MAIEKPRDVEIERSAANRRAAVGKAQRWPPDKTLHVFSEHGLPAQETSEKLLCAAEWRSRSQSCAALRALHGLWLRSRSLSVGRLDPGLPWVWEIEVHDPAKAAQLLDKQRGCVLLCRADTIKDPPQQATNDKAAAILGRHGLKLPKGSTITALKLEEAIKQLILQEAGV